MKRVVDVADIVVERDRRSAESRARSDQLRDARPPSTRATAPSADSIQESVAVLEDQQRAWERGFEAGIRAATTQFARGTRDDVPAPDDEPTAPYPVIDPE